MIGELVTTSVFGSARVSVEGNGDTSTGAAHAGLFPFAFVEISVVPTNNRIVPFVRAVTKKSTYAEPTSRPRARREPVSAGDAL